MKNPLAIMAAMKFSSSTALPSKLRAETKGTVRTIEMYGVIGESYWEDGITAKDVSAALTGPETDIVCRINSPGGSVFEGVTIYNVLKSSGKNIKVVVDGIAASAASVIAMAGDTVEMGTGTMMMVHKAWTVAIGDDSDMDKAAQTLRKVTASSAEIYTAKTGKTAEEIAGLLAAETWMSADDAVELGFADTKTETPGEAEALAKAFDLEAMYENTPEALKTFKQSATAAGAEKEVESIETSTARLSRLAVFPICQTSTFMGSVR